MIRQLLRLAHAPRWCASLLLVALCAPAMAQEAGNSIALIDIHQGGGLSETAARLGDGGYDLSDGTWQSFAQWYHTDWPDLTIEMITQLGNDNGILWGGGTGERGEKYTIDPSLILGLITQVHPRPNSTLSLTVTTTWFGHMSERPCEADYGPGFGVQTANCRLAANQMQPEDTLKYLVNADPSRLKLTLSYHASF